MLSPAAPETPGPVLKPNKGFSSSLFFFRVKLKRAFQNRSRYTENCNLQPQKKVFEYDDKPGINTAENTREPVIQHQMAFIKHNVFQSL